MWVAGSVQILYGTPEPCRRPTLKRPAAPIFLGHTSSTVNIVHYLTEEMRPTPIRPISKSYAIHKRHNYCIREVIGMQRLEDNNRVHGARLT